MFSPIDTIIIIVKVYTFLKKQKAPEAELFLFWLKILI